VVSSSSAGGGLAAFAAARVLRLAGPSMTIFEAAKSESSESEGGTAFRFRTARTGAAAGALGAALRRPLVGAGSGSGVEALPLPFLSLRCGASASSSGSGSDKSCARLQGKG
jgi:hypothetical protein